MTQDFAQHEADVLIIGGGLAGCMAAISAATGGAQVLVLEKANTNRSGAAATGNDHFSIWHPEIHGRAGWTIEHMVREQAVAGCADGELAEIVARTSYARMQDLERLGLRFRFSRVYAWNHGVEPGEYGPGDEQYRIVPQFYSVPTALNYDGRDIKRKLTLEMKKLGVSILQRHMVTALLVEGEGVAGATALDVRTGRFAAIRARSVVLATGGALAVRLFDHQHGHFSTSLSPPNCTGDGHALALRAGAEMTIRLPRYGGAGLAGLQVKGYPQATSLAATTSYPAGRIVTSDGETIAGLLFAPDPPSRSGAEKAAAALREGRGPLYVDLTQASEEEVEYAEWSLSNEALGWATLRVLRAEGIDLRTHRLELASPRPGFCTVRGSCKLGVSVDGQCRASLDKLWVAGDMLIHCAGSAMQAVCLGWHAGERAAKAAGNMGELPACSEQLGQQIRQEEQRTLAPLQADTGRSWQEVNLALVQIMRDNVAALPLGGASQMPSEYALGAAVSQIRELRQMDLQASNAHELMRGLEVQNLLDQGEFLVRAWQALGSDSEHCWSLGRLLDSRMAFWQRPMAAH